MEKNYILGSQMKMTYFPNIKNIFKSKRRLVHGNKKNIRDTHHINVLK